MAGAQSLGDIGIGGQGQDAGRRHHLVALENDGAIVQGRTRHENGFQQFSRYASIHGAARLDKIGQPDLAFEHDQAADPMRRQPGHRLSQLFGRRRHRPVKGQEGARAHARKRAPDIDLENHHQNNDQRTQKVVEQPVQGKQPQELRADVSRAQKRQPEYDLYRARAPDDQTDAIDHPGHHQDVDNILPAWNRYEFGPKYRHDLVFTPCAIAAAIRVTIAIGPGSCTRTIAAPAFTAIATAAAVPNSNSSSLDPTIRRINALRETPISTG